MNWSVVRYKIISLAFAVAFDPVDHVFLNEKRNFKCLTGTHERAIYYFTAASKKQNRHEKQFSIEIYDTLFLSYILFERNIYIHTLVSHSVSFR